MHDDYELAKKALDNSKVIAFPTETVMGFGIYYDDECAYHLLNSIKRRPEDKPYTLMLSSVGDIDKYAYLTIRDRQIINKFMPGPLTMLLKVKEGLPYHVTNGSDVIGIRVPDFKIPLEIINYVGKPLLVPSANRSGMPPLMDSEAVREEFKDELGYVVNGNALNGVPSTIVDFTKSEIKIIREGPISLEDIKKCLEE